MFPQRNQLKEGYFSVNLYSHRAAFSPRLKSFFALARYCEEVHSFCLLLSYFYVLEFFFFWVTVLAKNCQVLVHSFQLFNLVFFISVE